MSGADGERSAWASRARASAARIDRAANPPSTQRWRAVMRVRLDSSERSTRCAVVVSILCGSPGAMSRKPVRSRRVSLWSTRAPADLRGMNRFRLTRAALGAVALLAASTALAAPAHAAGLVKTFADCAPAPVSQPFGPWGDSSLYKLVDGGTFEDGAPGWRLSGRAEVVDGNEPAHVNGAGDASSLRVPAGSAALSAPVCIGHDEPTMRFFAARVAGPVSVLAVSV